MAIDPSAGLAGLAALAAPTETRSDDPDQAFAELFARTMLREVSKAMPEGSLLGGDLDMFSDLLLDELAASIAASGQLHLPAAGARAPRYASMAASPLPVDGRVSSGFGHRADPLHGGHRHHDGIDIAAPTGTPIQAVRGGVVVSAGERGGYGNTVVVRHRDGSEALYAHCDALRVREGDAVRPGQEVATVGSTGRSTGPHLHLEL